MKCIVCNQEIAGPLLPCPRCGFLQPAVVGDAAAAEALIAAKARKHKRELLSHHDIGLTIYHWKDDGGTVALDREERVSFGSGSALLEGVVWLEQKFARIPDAESLELELWVQSDREPVQRTPVAVRVPQGCYLLQVGARIDEDLSLKLLLKNPQGQTESQPLRLLSE